MISGLSGVGTWPQSPVASPDDQNTSNKSSMLHPLSLKDF